MNVRDEIVKECDEVKRMLLEKNDSYGDSAINPIQIFSKLGASEALRARIDDKLSRIQRSKENALGEDTIKDLIGYLVLIRIAEKTKLN